jgi:hypothetical protein
LVTVLLGHHTGGRKTGVRRILFIGAWCIALATHLVLFGRAKRRLGF